jgi:4-amino-4-deoxy-L-arabinose transferase-like glycosyltransferase
MVQLQKLVFLGVILLILFSVPVINAPLNDDYVYFFSVKNFIETGTIEYHKADTAALLYQVFYGVLFTYLFGLSHSTLILSTIVVSFVGTVVAYLIFRNWFSQTLSMLAALLILVNPVYFSLAHSFMTDVPALTYTLLSVYAFVLWQKHRKEKYIYLGLAFAVIGFWIRQYAILPIGGFILYKIFTDYKYLLNLKRIVLLFVLPIVSFGLWWLVYQQFHGPIVCPYEIIVGPNIAKNLINSALYLGYFLFPLALLYLVNYKKFFSEFRNLKIFQKVFLISLTLLLIAYPFILLYSGTSFNPFAFSLFNTRGVGAYLITGQKVNLLPEWTWIIFFILSIITIFGFLTFSMKILKRHFILIAFILASLLPTTLYKPFYDRYYLFIIPFSLPLVLAGAQQLKFTREIIITALLILFTISWYGVFENLSFNVARWKGISFLLDSGIEESAIDGGFEYNARFFESCVEPKGAVNFHSWAYSLSDEYVISFTELKNYETIKKIDYYGPFGEKLGGVFVLKKVV